MEWKLTRKELLAVTTVDLESTGDSGKLLRAEIILCLFKYTFVLLRQ